MEAVGNDQAELTLVFDKGMNAEVLTTGSDQANNLNLFDIYPKNSHFQGLKGSFRRQKVCFKELPKFPLSFTLMPP